MTTDLLRQFPLTLISRQFGRALAPIAQDVQTMPALGGPARGAHRAAVTWVLGRDGDRATIIRRSVLAPCELRHTG